MLSDVLNFGETDHNKWCSGRTGFNPFSCTLKILGFYVGVTCTTYMHAYRICNDDYEAAAPLIIMLVKLVVVAGKGLVLYTTLCV